MDRNFEFQFTFEFDIDFSRDPAERSSDNPLAMWRNCSEFRPSFLNYGDPEGLRMLCGSFVMGIQLLFFIEVVVKLLTGFGRFDFDVFEVSSPPRS